MNNPRLERSIGGRVVRVWTTDRSIGSVHPERVESPLLRARQIAATGALWATTDQVHGLEVVKVDGTEEWRPMVGRGDVLMTRSPGTQLSVWAADCAPLVLASDDGVLVAAHGGWRGLAAGVVDVAIDCATAMGGNIALAVLGPVIHPCCYEFGSDDLEAVANGLSVASSVVAAATANGSLALNVPGGIRAAFARHGVALEQVGSCTGCDERWYSHRARADIGRHAVVVEQVAA